MRAFVTFLLVSFIFAMGLVISSCCILLVNRDYTERSNLKIYCVGAGVTVAIITFALTVRPRCGNSCRLLTLLLGTFTGIGLTMAFCRDSASIIAAILIFIAMGYTLVIRDMLFEYLDLVARHTTTKEKVARLQTVKEKCLDRDSDFKLQEVPMKMKCKRFFTFCFNKKYPKS